MVKVKFSITYKTHPGQNLVVLGSPAALGAWEAAKAYRLTFTAPDVWAGCAEVSDSQFEYKYALEHNGNVTQEFGDNRAIHLGKHSEADLRDCWRPFGDAQNALYTSFFLQGIIAFSSCSRFPAL